ncbi:MAG: electron transfer flavoprotein, beta subunit [Candidatus Hecatellales archaeon B24]|nr:MAG: electron transfer flavoprotein, beta subunit [Candidatus Hecatellales archaeon B24]
MEIIVCAKYALDVAEIKIDPSGKPLLDGVPRRVSDIDKNAMEAAVNIKEKQGGTIKVVCFGPASAKEGLKELLAMGADEAYLVEDPSGGMLDTAATVEALAAAIQKIGSFDLILCGEATTDGYTGQVGPRLAGKLGIPQITYARNLNVEGNSVTAERDLEDAYETVKAPTPVLVSVTREINVPRIPSLMAILKASKKPMTIWKLEDLGLSKEKLEQVSTLQTVDLQGFAVERKRVVIKDKPVEEAVQELVSYLMKEKALGV